MKKFRLIFAFVLLTLDFFPVTGQDIDLYLKQKNSNFEIPVVSSQMSFSDYRLLSHDLRMMDMAYAAFVPGYTHFMAGDKTLGYSVVALRLAAYSTIGYLLCTTPEVYTPETVATRTKIIYSAAGVAIASYLFDWIHGKYVYEKKQDAIRYKYSIKAAIEAEADIQGTTLGVKLIF